MRSLVRRAAISVVAGFLASGFALGALIHTERPDEMRRLPEDFSGDLVLALLSALRGAGIPAALTVLLCVLVYDAVRWLAGQISARRDLFMPPLRLAATAIRHWWWWSAMPRIRRTVVAVALIVGSIFAGGLAVVIYAVVVSLSFEAVRASTRFVGALLLRAPLPKRCDVALYRRWSSG
ncbi:MAG: hypothetical protein AUH85_03065 [Chloroflexi bacterium 13_1_40CM_4_68_4]|nr:MAG: hypothetical protein AUH85_03065 [Chloroflexi bacterium 13_1_40CM_4_68_4]